MSSLNRRLRTAFLSIAMAAVPLGLWSPAPAQADESPTVMFVLDLSGSMNEKLPDGTSKIAAAKGALADLSSATKGAKVGFRVYGSEIAEPQKTNPAACRDTRVLVPPSADGATRVSSAASKLTAKGETLMTSALEAAANDVGTSGRRMIVLISDGVETCGGDPCKASAAISKRGLGLQVNTVGLTLNDKARSQLRCMADAGGGSHHEVDSADDFDTVLAELSKRAFRAQPLPGTPIDGSTSFSDAPTLSPGMYRDERLSPSEATWYRIPRHRQGLVTVSAMARTDLPRYEAWQLRLVPVSDPDQKCDESRLVRMFSSDGPDVVTEAVSQPGSEPGDEPELCDTDDLALRIERTKPGSAPLDLTLRVTTEQPISNWADLPEQTPDASDDIAEVPVTDQVKKAPLGGITLADATELTAGTWTTPITVGERSWYAVRLEPGQRLRATIRRGDQSTRNLPSLTLIPQDWSTKALNGGSPLTTEHVPEIRARNQFDPFMSGTARGGLYYLGVGEDLTRQSTVNRATTLTLSIVVEGKPAGQPEFAPAQSSTTPSPSVSPTNERTPEQPQSSSAPTTDEAPPADEARSNSAPWVGLGLGLSAAAGLIAALAWWGLKRRL